MFNPFEVLAIAKVIKEATEKAARKETHPGEYPVDFSIRIAGSIKVGEAYEQRIVAKADAWQLLAIALSKLNGVTVDSIVKEALACTLDPVSIKEQAEKAIQSLKAPTATTCMGKVTTQLTVVKVSK